MPSVPDPRISDSQLPGSNLPGPSGSSAISMSLSKDSPSGISSSLPQSTTASGSTKTASSSSFSGSVHPEITDSRALASSSHSSSASTRTHSLSQESSMATKDPQTTPTTKPDDPPKGQNPGNPDDGNSSSSSPASNPSPSGQSSSSTGKSASPSKTQDSGTGGGTTSKAPIPTENGASQQASSTVTSTTKVRGTPAILTSTSTSTLSPTSTFSSIVSIPITDPKDGHVSASIPAFVTEIYTSTEDNGSSVVVTNIIANPTEAFHTAAKQSSGLLKNQGATAGVFTAVGFVVAGLLFGIFWFCRRKRRRAQQKRWMHTLAANQEDDHGNPFSDPPEMRHTGDIQAPQAAQWSAFNQGGAGYNNRRDSGVPFNDYPVHGPPGLALTTDQPFDPTVSRAPSSPSIYPASLPPDNNGRDVDSFYEVEMGSGQDHRDPTMPNTPTNNYIQSPPPVATPADQVRRKIPPLYMPSPPASASGSQNSPRQSPEPVTKVQDSPILFTQRSLNHRPGSS